MDLTVSRQEADDLLASQRAYVDELRKHHSWVGQRPNMPLQQRALDEVEGEIRRHEQLLYKLMAARYPASH